MRPLTIAVRVHEASLDASNRTGLGYRRLPWMAPGHTQSFKETSTTTLDHFIFAIYIYINYIYKTDHLAIVLKV